MTNFFKRNIEFFIGLILTLSLLWPLFAAPFFTHHDDVQIIRLYEMNKCFQDGQIPCRWVPDLGGLYGYPIFNFYAPLPYYFGEIFYVLTHSLIWSVKIMFIFTFVGSYIFMFLLARKFWGGKGALISAVFYSFAPYHALNFYVRGAMGEMWGLMLFPAIFWAFTRLAERANLLNVLIATLAISALFASHNLSALIFLPLAAIWVVLLFLKRRQKKFLYFSLISAILAVTLASFYLLPMVFEKELVHLETTVEGYFSYTEHFKGLKKLFLERSWGWGASIREVPGGERDGLSYQIGWVHLLGWILALISAKALWRKNERSSSTNKWISLVIVFSSAAILLSVFMIHPRSEFVWRQIDPLKYLQFPWRFLMLIAFFICFISGSVTLAELKNTRLWVGVLIIAVVVLNFSYFRPEKFIQTGDTKLLTGVSWDKQIKRSIFDYLPIFAKEPPAELATERYKILTGDSRIYDFREGTNWFNFKADTKSHTIIRLSQYYFPDWKIFVDGIQSPIEYKDNSLGLMTLILGKGTHTISARLYDTPVRTIGNIISLVTFLGILVILVTQFKKVRRWISYYRKSLN